MDVELDTINHLRSMVASLQVKLDERNQLLAQIIPHIEAWNVGTEVELEVASSICFELLKKYGILINKFKDEYGNRSSQTTHAGIRQ
jgi:hypothetical protein